MTNSLQDLPAKVCLTASGCLIKQKKVLLIKHKKMGTWLCPGGHIKLSVDELPHQAAEREFLEETGLKVKAIHSVLSTSADGSEYVPNPVASNLHWVCQDNFLVRTKGIEATENCQLWSRGCEQHLNLIYLVEAVSGELTLKKNSRETDGLAWFELTRLEEIEMYDNVRQEIALCLEVKEQANA